MLLSDGKAILLKVNRILLSDGKAILLEVNRILLSDDGICLQKQTKYFCQMVMTYL